MSNEDIQGILFDSGDTLVFPKSGSWWPGPDFETILLRHGVEPVRFDPVSMEAALAEGLAWLDSDHFIVTLEEEMEQFRTFYRIITKSLSIHGTDELNEDLARAYVKECHFRLYPDTAPVLEKLANSDIVMGILSDAWPSLRNKFDILGVRHYFTSFTISSETGCCKPDDLIFKQAMDDIGIAPKNLLFIDNDIGNVRASIRLGMNGVVILRNSEKAVSDVPCIRNLSDILDVVR